MRTLLLPLSILSCALFSTGVYAADSDIPAGVVKFRINQQANANFADASAWTEYEQSGWQPIVLDNVPWVALPSTTRVQLKMDNSTATISAPLGSSSAAFNIDITGLYNSTLNINSDIYITGGIGTDGGSTINFNNVVYAGKKLDLRNGSSAYFTNSTFKAGDSNDLVDSGGNATFVMDASKFNTYYDGWDASSSGTARWSSNALFIGNLDNGQKSYTFKNGSVINGAGRSDGTSYFDIAGATRADLQGGSNFNLGWNPMQNSTDSLVVNIESGSKVALDTVEFMLNSGGQNSSVGTISWNQSGTDMVDGYTRVVLRGDMNMRASTSTQDDVTFKSVANMRGFTSLELNNLNIGQTNDALISGGAHFSMTGEGNSLDANQIAISNGGSRDVVMSGALSFYSKSDNVNNKNTITIRSSELLVQSSTAVGSELTVDFTLAGNTVLRGGDGKGVWLKVNEWGGKNYTSRSSFNIIGAGNDILLSGLEIGKDTSDGGGEGVFKIIGGGSSILIQNDNDGHNGFRLQKGGVLHFGIDDTGISAIKNDTWNNTTFEGRLEVDFTALTGAEYIDERYVLFVTSDQSLQNESRMNLWFDFTDWGNLQELGDFIEVRLKTIDDEYRFALETYYDSGLGKDVQALVIYYTTFGLIPEPSVFAAAFGLVAMFFALRRRKHN